jgi:hypothetical protein
VGGVIKLVPIIALDAPEVRKVQPNCVNTGEEVREGGEHVGLLVR